MARYFAEFDDDSRPYVFDREHRGERVAGPFTTLIEADVRAHKLNTGGNMIADVTQNLIVRVSPVNNPSKFNAYGEQLGYYHAFVSHDEHQINVAQSEWMRGIVHAEAGYGYASTALYAIEHAISDYIAKFGALCVADTNEV